MNKAIIIRDNVNMNAEYTFCSIGAVEKLGLNTGPEKPSIRNVSDFRIRNHPKFVGPI